MVYTRRQNTKAGANHSKTVFSKEHNDLFIKKVQEYSLYAKGEILNSFVLGLNKSSTEEDIKKPIVPCLFNFTLCIKKAIVHLEDRKSVEMFD